MNVNDYVLDVFQGTGVVINTISMNGLPGDSMNQQIGTFQNNGGYLPISQGLVMSSGAIIGVNFDGDSVSPGQSTSIIVENGLFDEIDLEVLSDGPVNDVAVLEFDVIPTFQYLIFNYSFASEEYPEYVGSFNDAFGFFVSGPGLSGPYSNGAVNIALLPDSASVVSINSVNNGSTNCFSGGPVGPCMNCEFYIDNCSIEATALDGMTTNLTAAIEVIPGELYHFKLAIGDAFDTAFDSAVFLEQNSFKSVASLPLGLAELNLIQDIYPNPSNGQVTIELAELQLSGINIVNIDGKVVWTDYSPMQGGTKLTLNLDQLSSGTYFLEAIHEKGSSFHRISIQ
jgi:hypothetical protein